MPKALRNLAFTLLALLILILLILWLATPPVARHYLEQFFAEQNAEFSAENISLNPLTSRLEVSGLLVTQAGETVLSADLLRVSLRLPDLFDRTLHINELLLDGIFLQISQQEHEIHIAGIDLSPSAETEQAQPQEEPDASSTPWGLTLPAAEIRNSRILANRNERADELVIQSFQINNFSARGQELQGKISLDSLVNQAPLRANVDVNGADEQLELISQLTLENFSIAPLLEFLPPELLGSSALLSLELSAAINLDGQSLGVSLANTTAKVTELQALYPPYRVNSTELQLNLPEFRVSLQDGELTNLHGGYRLETDATRLYYQNEQQLLAGWESITTQGGKLTLQDTLEVQLPDLQLSGLTVSQSQTAQEVLPALLQLDRLQLQNLAYSEQEGHLDLDLIAIHQIDTKLLLSADGEPLNLLKIETTSESPEVATAQMASPETAAMQAETDDVEPTEQSVSFRLGRLDISGTNTLTVIDRSATPEVLHTLVLESFYLDQLDTRRPTQASPFQLRGNAGGYSSIQAEGEIALFTEKPNLNLTQTIREFELPPLSPYISDSLGYEIEAGQLDLDLKLAIVDGIIDGHAGLNLRRTDLGPPKNAPDQAAGSGLIPLNVALGMLKDSKGNIELDIPLSGDTENPNFSISGFVTRTLGRAILQGASTYAMQAFVPYANVITVAQIAGQQLLKIRFNPLELEPGQLDSADTSFIEQFGKLLQEREDLQVKICGYATVADLNLAPGTQELTEDQLKQLQDLAGRRANHFKQKVIDAYQIPSARMLTCNAGVDSGKDARPRLEFET